MSPAPNQPVDPQRTDPPTQPTIPVIADKLGAGARSWIYALLGPVFTLVAMVRAGADPVDIAIALVPLLGFGVAFANVPRTTTPGK